MTVQSRTYSVPLDASNNPQALTLAGAAVGFTTTRWVVINNLTPYIMELSGIGDQPESQGSLAPGTANKFQWTNQYGPLIANWVNPITGPPPSTPQVVVEYSDDPTGKELAGSYPTTLQSGVFIGTVSGPVTITGSVSIAGGSVSVTNNVTVTPSGTVNVQGVAGGTAIGIAGSVTITSGTVSISGTPTVNIAAGQSVSISGTPNVNVTGGSISISSGSVSIAGNVTILQVIDNVNVNAPVDALVNTTHNFPTTAAFSTTVTPTTGVEQMRIRVALSSGSMPCTILVHNVTNNLQEGCQVNLGVLGSAEVTLPVPADPGDSVTLTITPNSAAGLPSNMSIIMVGLGSGNIIETQPGAPISVYNVGGTQKAQGNWSTTGGVYVNILPAPPLGMAYRLHLISCNVGSSNGYVVDGLNNAAPVVAFMTNAQTIPMNGQLCTSGVGIVTGSASAGGTVFVTYDLISLPVIQ